MWPPQAGKSRVRRRATFGEGFSARQRIPCPLYVSGPHRNGEWDLYSDDFGHYNPKAIQWLADLAKKVVSDKKFVEASKPLVDKYLYRQMICMPALRRVGAGAGDSDA